MQICKSICNFAVRSSFAAVGLHANTIPELFRPSLCRRATGKEAATPLVKKVAAAPLLNVPMWALFCCVCCSVCLSVAVRGSRKRLSRYRRCFVMVRRGPDFYGTFVPLIWSFFDLVCYGGNLQITGCSSMCTLAEHMYRPHKIIRIIS